MNHVFGKLQHARSGYRRSVMTTSRNISIAVASVLLALAGCKSHRDRVHSDANSASAQSSAATARSSPGIDLNCVIDHIQNPPEAFRYSYKVQSSYPVEEQADITPQTIDGSFKNNDAERPLHGVRSDAQSWSAAWSGLTGISGMSSTVALISNSSAIVPEGSEKINGYDTTKLSIDTARANMAEQGLYRSTLGAGGFEKGTAWVTSLGCPVKLNLDSEMHLKNGDADKTHYEIEMVRK
jgi:hypothetical protein